MINILFFAGIKEKLNMDRVKIEKEKETVHTIAELRQWLKETYPTIQEDLEQAIIAVNEEFVDEQTTLQAHDEVAIIPPVSGG